MIRIGRHRRDSGISVARGTALGNPFVVDRPYTREEAISRYRDWLPQELVRNAKAREQLQRIVSAAEKGDICLLCWCEPRPCHAEVIREYVESIIAARTYAADRE